MKSPVDKRFHVTDHSVDQRQPYSRLSGGSQFFPVMLRFTDSIKNRQSICLHRLISFKVFAKKLANGYFGSSVNSLHGNKSGPFLRVSTATRTGRFPSAPRPLFPPTRAT
jgi:hypothetical protein